MGKLTVLLKEHEGQLFTEMQLIRNTIVNQLQKAKVLVTFVYKLWFSCKVNLNEPSTKR